MERNKDTTDLIDQTTEDFDVATQGLSYLLACIFCLALAILFSLGVIVQTGDTHVVQLQMRINPNDAPAASLVRLPQIGMTRAEKIIAYRRTYAGDEPAFKCTEDLQKVKGIGPVIAAGLSDCLMFDKKN
jgi:DNA uptake protein ComE-like DNA-binding protein